jgi:site-specific recombinase XerD
MLERIWNKACEKAEIKINLYNGLKHSFGCQRLNQGFSIDQIQAVMGHTSPKTTERYAKYITENLSPVMRGKFIDMTQQINYSVKNGCQR